MGRREAIQGVREKPHFGKRGPRSKGDRAGPGREPAPLSPAAPMTCTFGTLENVVGRRRNIAVFFLALFFSLLKTHHFPLLSATCHNHL